MIIHQVEIKRFRGIRELCWKVGGDICCLVGPGDSTKSSILLAIELALAPRWNIAFSDADFFCGETEEPFEITVTVGDLPESLIDEYRFGLLTRGWTASNELRDDPNEEEGDKQVLSIRLKVDQLSLEPSWTVMKLSNKEGKPISAADRERLGVVSLGEVAERHFTWASGSVLSRLTGNVDEFSATLTGAKRSLRSGLEIDGLSALHQAALQAQLAANELGVAPMMGYRPDFDFQATRFGAGSFALHDGNIPLRQAGLGSRRLLTLGMQQKVKSKGGITLVDEVEYGLEPHRIRRLLKKLEPIEIEQSAATTGGEGVSEIAPGGREQVLMTTHSPIVVGEVLSSHLRVVRAHQGRVNISHVPADLKGIVRRHPESLLGKKVLVCEGKTEMGFLRALDSRKMLGFEPLAYHGIVLAFGNGRTNGPTDSVGFARLGYRTAFLGDSDAPLVPTEEDLRQKGVTVVLWEGSCSLEERLALDLPGEAVLRLAQVAIDRFESEEPEDGAGLMRVLRDINREFQGEQPRLVGIPAEWLGQIGTMEPLRRAIGAAAKGSSPKEKAGWFKRVDLGEELGALVASNLLGLADSSLLRTINLLKDWIQSDD